MMPAVTVITPALNAEAYLGETVESVLHQTFRDFEWIIVDDGSCDDTYEVASRGARRDRRIRVCRRANGGISAARNTALAIARGDFIALLDSDDTWLPEFLATQLEIFDRNPEIAVVTANAYNRGGPLDGTTLWPASAELAPIGLIDMIEKTDAVCILAMFRRVLFDRIGGFDETLRGNEDYEFWLRAAQAGFRFLANHAPLGCYRRREDSVSADESRMIAGIVGVLEGLRPLCPAGTAEHRAIDRQIEDCRMALLLTRAKGCLRMGNGYGAAEYIRGLVGAYPRCTVEAAAILAQYCPHLLSWVTTCRRAVRAATAQSAM